MHGTFRSAFFHLLVCIQGPSVSLHGFDSSFPFVMRHPLLSISADLANHLLKDILQEAWQHTGRLAAGEEAESSTSGLAGSRKTVTH